MIITRNTMRADGQSVGQAMDKDSAFLRSLGFDAPDGAMTDDEKREAFEYMVRDVVLDALDHAFGKGWIDDELPTLFLAVDAHAKALYERGVSNKIDNATTLIANNP